MEAGSDDESAEAADVNGADVNGADVEGADVEGADTDDADADAEDESADVSIDADPFAVDDSWQPAIENAVIPAPTTMTRR